jgi:speckle-type POZ protein
VIELKEDDARVVEAMLHFFYRFDYDSSGDGSRGWASPMLFNSRVYGIAEKYDIPALKFLAGEKVGKAVRTCWDMDDFTHVITDIYNSTPPTDRGLRDIVVEVAHSHIDTLLEKEEFRCALEETPGFAADITRQMAEKGGITVKEYSCPECGKQWKAVLTDGTSSYCIHCGESRSDWSNYVV